MSWTVCLDPGHGGRDPGAVSGNLQEAPTAYDIALRVLRILEHNNSEDVEVKLTRGPNEDPPQSARAYHSNAVGADIFVSIHCNAAESKKARGFEFIIAPMSEEADKLADCLEAAFLDTLEEIIPPRNPAVKYDTQLGRGLGFKLTVLRKTEAPAVLVETGFVTSKDDRMILESIPGREKIAFAIAEGILDYLTLYKGGQNNGDKEKSDDKEGGDEDKEGGG